MNTFFIEYRRNAWCVIEYHGITNLVARQHSVATREAADLLRAALIREASSGVRVSE